MTYIHIICINVIFISLQYYPRGIICTHTYTHKKEGIKLEIMRHVSLLTRKKKRNCRQTNSRVQNKIDHPLENSEWLCNFIEWKLSFTKKLNKAVLSICTITEKNKTKGAENMYLILTRQNIFVSILVHILRYFCTCNSQSRFLSIELLENRILQKSKIWLC